MSFVMLNLSNGNCSFSVVVLLLTTRSSTFDNAISVLELASTSCDVTAKYDLPSYETHPVVAAFTKLEREIKERYTLFKVHPVCPLAPILRGAKSYC